MRVTAQYISAASRYIVKSTIRQIKIENGAHRYSYTKYNTPYAKYKQLQRQRPSTTHPPLIVQLVCWSIFFAVRSFRRRVTTSTSSCTLPNKRIKQRRRRKKHTRIIIILLLHLLVVFRSLFMAHRLFCCFQACGPLFVVDVGASTYFLFLFDIIQQSTWWQSHNNIHYIEYTTINHG